MKIAKKLFIFVLMLSLTVPVYASSTKDQLNDAEEGKKEAQSRLEEIQDKIAELEQKKLDVQRYISEVDAQLAEIVANLEELELKKTAKEEEIVQTEQELEVARAVEAEQYASMKVRIQCMYENGNQSYLDIILGSSNISEMLNKAEYVSELTAYDRKMLEEYQITRADIENKEARLIKEHEELKQLVAEAEDEKAGLEYVIAQKSEQMAQYEMDIADSEADVEEMRKEVEAFDNQIAALEEKLRQETTRVIYDGGQFAFPLTNYSRITSPYGWREHPIFHTQKYHSGIDFGANYGTPILAAYDGEVVVSEYSSSAGNYIMINHGNGLTTVYMHSSKLIAQVGDYVHRGDTIALVGSTGNSTGPHLHFSVRLNGEYVDPGPYIGIY